MNVQENRLGLLKHLYGLPVRGRGMSSYLFDGAGHCLCAKGQVAAFILGTEPCATATIKIVREYDYAHQKIDPEIQLKLDLTNSLWREMEIRYEGFDQLKYGPRHNFKQIADWLQTQAGWPSLHREPVVEEIPVVEEELEAVCQ